MRNCMALLVSFMFEKITKYFANRAADNVVDGVSTSINEKFDQYGDIIRIGLVLGVIILGGRHITKRDNRNNGCAYINPPGSQPIIINNYYPGSNQAMQQDHNERKRRSYDERQNYIPAKQAGQMGRNR